MTDRSHAVVVGGGVAGVAIARALAPETRVTVLERGAIAGDTTSRASGVISLPLEPFSDAVLEYGQEWFRELDGTGTFTFTERPTTRLLPSDVVEAARASAPEGARYLDVEELREEFPGAFDDLSGYEGALVYEGTGWLDPVDYAVSMKHDAENNGAEFYRDRTVTGLRTENGEVTGVDTDWGPVDADYVVYATGWRTRELLAEYVDVPTRPYRWNAVVVDPEYPAAMGFPMGSEPEHRLYWRPTRHRNVLVGGNEHFVDDPVGAEARVDDDFVDTVFEELGPVVRGLGEGRVVRADCCPTADTATADGFPIVDAPSEGPDGLVVATGFHGRGVMLSGVTARAVKELVTGEAAPFDIGPFSLGRFTDRSVDFELLSHWE